MNLLRRLLTAAAVALGLAFANVPTAHGLPIDLTTPAGLNPGDTFRFVFVTDGQLYGNTGTINAVSSNISDYNTFVNAQAAGATYGGVTISWKAIGSTATVHARDNVGGYNTLVPIYIVDGTRVANDLTENTGGFWSGSLLGTGPSRTKIHLAVDGTDVNSYTWTGTNDDGTAYSGYELGNGGSAEYGDSNATSGFLAYSDDDPSYTMPMFAMSATLTVAGPAAVPEIDPAGMGSVLALVTGVLGLLERRRLRMC